MALPTNPEAYQHIQSVLDAVLGEPNATYKCATNKAAIRWRMEAYYFRKLMRAQKDHRYDDLVLKVNDDTVVFSRRVASGELRDAKGNILSLAPHRPLTPEEAALEDQIFAFAQQLNLDKADDE